MKVKISIESHNSKDGFLTHDGYVIADQVELQKPGVTLKFPTGVLYGDYLVITPLEEEKEVIVEAKCDPRTPNLILPADEVCDKVDRIHESGSEVSKITILLPKGFLYGIPIEWREA